MHWRTSLLGGHSGGSHSPWAQCSLNKVEEKAHPLATSWGLDPICGQRGGCSGAGSKREQCFLFKMLPSTCKLCAFFIFTRHFSWAWGLPWPPSQLTLSQLLYSDFGCLIFRDITPDFQKILGVRLKNPSKQMGKVLLLHINASDFSSRHIF